MKKDITILAEPRDSRGKNEARRLRARGLAPAVLYGTVREPVAVSISPKEIGRILHSNTGHNTIFNLDVQGKENTPVMIVDWQDDPIKSTLLHVDLKRIDLTRRIVVKVPMYTTGEPKGVKLQGGLLEAITREIEIECLPEDIPERFTVDVSELMMGQSVRAADVPMTGSMKLLGSPENVIAHVVAIKAEVAPAEAEAAVEGAAPAAAEPEVIKKGKKEEEGAAEPEAKGKKK
ncbi:MAG TPA: 50S ribosomal protein L25 [Bryobacteraceae bacterium]|nr:50S ribosomal protein L25 [Bryobacteraceae bacterium]